MKNKDKNTSRSTQIRNEENFDFATQNVRSHVISSARQHFRPRRSLGLLHSHTDNMGLLEKATQFSLSVDYCVEFIRFR